MKLKMQGIFHFYARLWILFSASLLSTFIKISVFGLWSWFSVRFSDDERNFALGGFAATDSILIPERWKWLWKKGERLFI